MKDERGWDLSGVQKFSIVDSEGEPVPPEMYTCACCGAAPVSTLALTDPDVKGWRCCQGCYGTRIR